MLSLVFPETFFSDFPFTSAEFAVKVMHKTAKVKIAFLLIV